MKSKAPKKSKRVADDSRAALIDAATELFAERGYDATSTRDIVDAAGINISLIAYHFGGKEGLLDAVLEKIAENLDLRTRELYPPESKTDMELQIKRLIISFLKNFTEAPSQFKLINREMERGSPSFKRVLKDHYLLTFQKMIQFFASASERGFINPKLSPGVIVMSLQGMMGQQMRLDQFRKELFGTTLHDEAFATRVADEIYLLLTRGLTSSD